MKWVVLGVLLLALPTADAASPACERTEPSESTTLMAWESRYFALHCQDTDGDLAYASWTKDGDLYLDNITAESGYIDEFTTSARFDFQGLHHVTAIVYDKAGNRAEMWWNVTVTPYIPTQEPESGWTIGWPKMNPVEVFSAIVAAIVGLGGLALGIVQLRRSRTDSPTAPQQIVQAPAGAVVGTADTVIVNGPPIPEVPTGIPPLKRNLYLALAKAHVVLDRLSLTERRLEARSAVKRILNNLNQGDIPVREERKPVAAAIRAVMASDAEPVTAQDAAMLQDAVNELEAS